MNKKQYNTPTLEVIHVEAHCLLADSYKTYIILTDAEGEGM